MGVGWKEEASTGAAGELVPESLIPNIAGQPSIARLRGNLTGPGIDPLATVLGHALGSKLP